jgi:hypothetical protein
MFGTWGDSAPLKAPTESEQVQPSNDPRNKIFGGNGMHI